MNRLKLISSQLKINKVYNLSANKCFSSGRSNNFLEAFNLLRNNSLNCPSNVIVLLCDIQDKYISNIYKNNTLLNNIEVISKITRLFNYDYYITEHVPQIFGKTHKAVTDCLKSEPTNNHLNKGEINQKSQLINLNNCESINSKTCFSMISDNQVDPNKIYILVGIETHICVLNTAFTILKNNGKVIVIKECVSSSTEYDRNIGLKNLEEMGVIITSIQTFLMFVTQDAKNEKFKSILSVLKNMSSFKNDLL